MEKCLRSFLQLSVDISTFLQKGVVRRLDWIHGSSAAWVTRKKSRTEPIGGSICERLGVGLLHLGAIGRRISTRRDAIEC
jgi:hypothetical protein